MLLLASIALPIAMGAPSVSLANEVELGGRVVERTTDKPFPSPVPMVVNLYSDTACVAGGSAGPDGSYSLVAPAGRYWVQVLAGNDEVDAEPVSMSPAASTTKNFFVPSPVDERPMRVLAQARTPQRSTFRHLDHSRRWFLGDAHRDGLLLEPPRWDWRDSPARVAAELRLERLRESGAVADAEPAESGRK